jgi:Tfp pilus assembly protein FimT
MRNSGFSLPEALVALVLLGTTVLLAAPLVERMSAESRIRSAGHEAALAFHRARSEAVRTGVETAVRVEQNNGAYRLGIYCDGNGNGVRNHEIDRGIDRPDRGPQNLFRRDVTVGILQNVPVPDPSDPRRKLSRLDDPVRFNNSNLCSFSPLCESTPGSLYLTDGRTKMAVVRVFNRTGRVHLLYFTAGDARWKP